MRAPRARAEGAVVGGVRSWAEDQSAPAAPEGAGCDRAGCERGAGTAQPAACCLWTCNARESKSKRKRGGRAAREGPGGVETLRG